MLAIVLILAVAGSLVFPFPLEGRLWGEIFNLAHAPVFFVTLLLLVGLPDPSAIGAPPQFSTIIPITFRRALTIAGGVMTLGILCEYIQRFANRSPSLTDILANTVGVLAALIWIRLCTSSKRRGFLQKAALPVLLLFSISLPTLCQLFDSVQQILAFPVIGSFERRFEVDGWDPHRAQIRTSDEWSTHGQKSLEVELRQAPYPGVAILWFEGDWRQYRYLELDLQNPSQESLEVVVKLNDRRHWKRNFPDDDRFHQLVKLPAETHVPVKIDLRDVRSAPASREMDMDDMTMIDLFAPDVSERRIFRVDNIRLTGGNVAE